MSRPGIAMGKMAKAARRAWFFSAWKAAPLYGKALYALAVASGLVAMGIGAELLALAVRAAEDFLPVGPVANNGVECLKVFCVDVGGMRVDVIAYGGWAIVGVLTSAVVAIRAMSRPWVTWPSRGLHWIEAASRGACENAQRRWMVEKEAGEIEASIGDAGLNRRGRSGKRL